MDYVQVQGGKHAMPRRHKVLDALAADFTVRTLLTPQPHTPIASQFEWREV